MAGVWRDLRYSLRSLLKDPGFTAVTALTLALGIGANAAMFSLVNGLLLEALPYLEADQLVMVWTDNRRAGLPQDLTSYANLTDYGSQSQSFQHLAAFRDGPVTFSDTDAAVLVRGAAVSSAFFAVMRVAPLLGRAIRAEEDTLGSAPVALLGHGFWQQYLGGDASVVGRSIRLNHQPVTVIGVMPPGFQFPPKAEVWLNLPAAYLKPEYYAARDSKLFTAIGRLRPGISLASARAEMSTIAGRLERQYAKENEGYGVTLIPLREQWLGDVARMLWLLFGTTGFVLLIACVNTASLMLARGAARRREDALRLALGAGRARLVRQLLSESLLLVGLGGLAGVTLAWAGIRLFVAANPFNIWGLDRVSLDARVLGFTVVVCLLTGLLFGLAPAWQASTRPMAETLKAGSWSVTTSRSGSRLRELLVAVEVALAVMLLVGAGLMIQSFRQLQHVDLGFSPERLLTFRLALPNALYPDQATLIAFHQRLHERLAALPGVKSAGFFGDIFAKDTYTVVIQIEGHPLSQAGQNIDIPGEMVSPTFFQTMGIPLRRGRTFDQHDQPDSPPVVIVNEAMAKRFWPSEDPIGKRLKTDYDERWMSVVGVVADFRHLSLERDAVPALYFPLAQSYPSVAQIVVRTEGDPRGLAPAIPRCARELDKNLPIQGLQTLDQLLADRLAPRYYTSLLLSLFALAALMLAAVGILGVLSHLVRQRTHEIGIRVALGARPGEITMLIVRRGILLMLMGLAAGLVGALALARLISALLYGVSAFDLTNLLIVSLVLLATTVLASYLPSRRAARIEPMVALRSE